jgi:hypothetical protein
MSDDPTEYPNDVEARLLRSLADAPVPSAELEDRIVRTLERRGLLRAGGRQWIMAMTKAVGIAAALGVVFLVGFKTGDQRASTQTRRAVAIAPSTGSDAQQYMLFMFMRGRRDPGTPAPDPTSPGYRAVIEEYRAWAEARSAEGRLVSAEIEVRPIESTQ